MQRPAPPWLPEPVEGDFQDTGRAVRRRLNHLIRSFESDRVDGEREG